MGKIRLLDCTLRDGGYINDWRFGDRAVREIIDRLLEARMDFIEVGFLRDQPKAEGRTVFRSAAAAGEYTHGAVRDGTVFCAMCEAMNPLPLEMLQPKDGGSLAAVRVIVWKRLLREGFEYCRGIVDRGYRLCVQPNRVDQYSPEEFRETVRLFNRLSPLAFYIVDSFGLLHTSEILSYAQIADEELDGGAALGYHGHNNLQQAFGAAQAILAQGFRRDIMLDASVYGIGRGAGNLCTETIAQYLNESFGTQYRIEPLLEINDRYIQDIYKKERWGYSPGYFLTAKHRCNPMYAHYYEGERRLSAAAIDGILKRLAPEDKIIFTRDKAESYAAEWEP